MKIENEAELIEYGRGLAGKLRGALGDGLDGAAVVELVGDVGVGKTTLTRGLAEGLGVVEPVTSPSFTISKEYALPSGGRLVHYDFYRLGDPGLMAEDLAENLANPANVVVVEWGESVSDLLPEGHLRVEISYAEDGGREVGVG